MGPYVSDEELFQAVATALGTTAADLPRDQWMPVVAAANLSASRDIEQSLLALGHVMASIDAWDQRASFNKDLGCFWAITRGAGLGNYPAPQLKNLDRREELRKMTVLIVNGEAVAPVSQASAVGGISHGRSTAAASAEREFRRFDGRCW